MSNTSVPVTVHILDKEYRVACAADEQEDLLASARYLDGKMRLGPLETRAFLVEKRDTRGGSGANFIVVWDAEELVYEPLIEAIMVGFSDSNSISFTSPGRALVKRKD